MKKIILIQLVLAVLFSCKKKNTNTESSTENEELIEVGKVVESEKTESEIGEGKPKDIMTKAPKVVLTENQLEKVVSDFQNCKAVSTKREDCRNAITKFISTTYQLNEFKNKNGGYEIYDSIQPIISSSKNWRKIGIATNQQQINKAVEYANNGGLALVIDTSNTYGQVVMIQPGATKKSGSWSLKLPNVLSLANHNASKSFQGKSLAYAFKKSNNLEIYIRE